MQIFLHLDLTNQNCYSFFVGYPCVRCLECGNEHLVLTKLVCKRICFFSHKKKVQISRGRNYSCSQKSQPALSMFTFEQISILALKMINRFKMFPFFRASYAQKFHNKEKGF